MAIQNQLQLIPLPTKAEIEARLEIIKAYIAEVPIRSANTIVKHVDSAQEL